MRPASFLLLLWTACPAPARAQDVLAAVRADHWAAADAAAAALPDPLAGKLVLYYRLLTPGAASASEIAAFLADNPAWPGQRLLGRRLSEALAAQDDQAARDLCLHLAAPPATLRCPGPATADEARAAWVHGADARASDPASEAAFIRQWGGSLTADDQWQRFDRLAWTDPGTPGGPAARQAARLDPEQQAAAQARLALRRDDAVAPALVALLPPASRADPGVVLDLARWYRRAGLDKDAVEVWKASGAAAETAAAGDRRPAFWTERNALARRLLRFGSPADAYAVTDAAVQDGEAALDAEFLAGWIALRRLQQPETAAKHFLALAGLSAAAITQARAQYWLGRSRTALGDGEGARTALLAAAAWPTTYYGQLAACLLGEDAAALAQRIQAVHDPAWTEDAATAFAGQELARAAAILVAWGDPRRAKAFLLRLDETAGNATERALAASFASGLGVPDQAVAIARRAGRDGLMLPSAGWPLAVSPPTQTPTQPPAQTVDPAITLGLIRQESSFDVQAVSPVGARGLMQLMPATAAAVAHRLGEPVRLLALTADAAYNMRLGTAYLQGLLDQFHDALPLALAAYNAGPHRVQDWLTAQGDPVAGGTDMIDWIELIPFAETRNYVQRVIENVVIYHAHRGEPAPHPLARWLG